MMSNLSKTLLSLPLFTVMAGCFSPALPEQDLGGIFDDTRQEIDRQIDVACECEISGERFGSLGECRDHHNLAVPADFDCALAALDEDDAGVLLPLARCQLVAEEQYTDCREDAACDGETVERCLERYFESIRGCGAIPEDIVSKVDAMCVSQERNDYACSNGNEVPQGWVCDGFDDCGDHSDETNC